MKKQTEIFISLSTYQSASWGWEQIGSNNTVFQVGIDCLNEDQWCKDIFSFIIREKSMQKYNKRKNDLHLKSSFFITVLGLDVVEVAVFGVVISHTIEYQVL